MTNDEKVLFSDKERSIIDSELCRILEFVPMASYKNNKITKTDSSLPYASILFECSNQAENLRSFITHKEDFKALWYAFNERKINEDEEVLFIWSNKHYKNSIYSLLSKFMPKMWVMICRKNSYELHTDNNYKPELKGQARFLATEPIEEFKPDVME